MRPALGAEAKEAKKIGLAVANLQANFFNQIKESVEADGAEKGIKVITVDAKGDAATQVNQIQDLLAQNIDALIYIPAGATAAAVPVKAARAAGVPVINIDRNADGAPGDTFIATDSVESARQVCDWIAKQAGGKGEMLIIHGQKGTTPEVDRSKGCGIALKNYPDIKVVGELWSEGWHQDEGFKLTADLLQAHPKTDIIFGQADALALGAAQAVKVANPDHQHLGRRLRRRYGRAEGPQGRRVRRHRDPADAEDGPHGPRLGDRAREGREAAARAASGRDADDEGQRRRLHREASVTPTELGGAPSRAARFSRGPPP